MTFRKLLLGTTALLGAGVLGLAAPRAAGAAEVTPGGALDISVSGFAYFRAHWGDLDNARLDPTVGTGLDFSNDTEVHIIVKGKHDATGIEYGGTVEFEADTDRSDNTDESWLFVEGQWGELRFGDEDGVVDNSGVGGSFVAAGTGGIDGSVIDTIAVGLVKPTNTDDATKIRYYSPSFGGLTLAASYTPNADTIGSGAGNGDDIANSADIQVGDVVEGGLIYEGDLGGLGLTASLVGEYGDVKDESADTGVGGDDFWGWMAGAAVDVFGFKLSGGYFQSKVGDSERDVASAGIGAALGPANVSLTGGYVTRSDNLTSNGADLDNPYNVVLSADVGLMPGLVLAGDVGYFDNDVDDDNGVGGGDDGYQAVVRLGLAF